MGTQDSVIRASSPPSFVSSPHLRARNLGRLIDSSPLSVDSPLSRPARSIILDVDADGKIAVLNGDRKMTQEISNTPAGIA